MCFKDWKSCTWCGFYTPIPRNREKLETERTTEGHVVEVGDFIEFCCEFCTRGNDDPAQKSLQDKVNKGLRHIPRADSEQKAKLRSTRAVKIRASEKRNVSRAKRKETGESSRTAKTREKPSPPTHPASVKKSKVQSPSTFAKSSSAVAGPSGSATAANPQDKVLGQSDPPVSSEVSPLRIMSSSEEPEPSGKGKGKAPAKKRAKK